MMFFVEVMFVCHIFNTILWHKDMGLAVQLSCKNLYRRQSGQIPVTI